MRPIGLQSLLLYLPLSVALPILLHLEAEKYYSIQESPFSGALDPSSVGINAFALEPEQHDAALAEGRPRLGLDLPPTPLLNLDASNYSYPSINNASSGDTILPELIYNDSTHLSAFKTRLNKRAETPNQILIYALCIPSILTLFGIALYLEKAYLIKLFTRSGETGVGEVGEWSDLPEIEPIRERAPSNVSGAVIGTPPLVYKIDCVQKREDGEVGRTRWESVLA